MSDTKIVETIEDQADWPEWAAKAFKGGTFFRDAIKLVDEKDKCITKLTSKITTLRAMARNVR